MPTTNASLRLSGSERLPLPGSTLIAPMDANEPLTVTIKVRRRPDGKAVPSHGNWNWQAKPAATTYSRQTFESNFGAAQEELDKVATFVQSHGLAVLEMHRSRRSVSARGSAAQMNSAFGVDLGIYSKGNQRWRGRTGHVYLPPELEHIVTGVFGFDNQTIGGHNEVIQANVKPLTPLQVASLYNFPANVDATGQTIGILEMGGGFQTSDVNDYFASLGMAAPDVTSVSIDGVTNQPGHADADSEVLLDICVAGAVAKGAKIAVYFAPQNGQGWVNAINRAIHPGPGDPTPSVLSISWYVTNGDDPATMQAEGVTAAEIDEISAALQDAMLLGAHGPAIFVASGDTGSDSKVGDHKAHVQYPASDPWVTCCGGTIVSSVNGGSFEETTWNDLWNGQAGATGGGVSYHFAVPAWQNNAAVPASANGDGHRGRGIPDISGNASANSGYPMTLNGTVFPAAGTSAVAPLYAGLGALLNAALGQQTGFLNGRLYQLAAARGLFRDVSDGGTNALNGAPGYKSGPGWDACTGWGSVNGKALLEALKAI